jgi:hypothetical protein
MSSLYEGIVFHRVTVNSRRMWATDDWTCVGTTRSEALGKWVDRDMERYARAYG